ncbi:MAG: glycogen/starch/alpha-glucan phosphorylase [Lachnospiraceae bacterium]|nr:glycogen/starch/alpha-glucan phosphorylase [Lachnospiraceae bacterium]
MTACDSYMSPPDSAIITANPMIIIPYTICQCTYNITKFSSAIIAFYRLRVNGHIMQMRFHAERVSGIMTEKQKMLVNIAEAGYFSSDRTIKDYNREIWKL